MSAMCEKHHTVATSMTLLLPAWVHMLRLTAHAIFGHDAVQPSHMPIHVQGDALGAANLLRKDTNAAS